MGIKNSFRLFSLVLLSAFLCDTAEAKFKYNAHTGKLDYYESVSIGGTVTSGTEGSVLFLGSGGVLAHDNSNLFWNDTDNWLGIGGAPTVTLDVFGDARFNSNGTNHFRIRNSSTGTIPFQVDTNSSIVTIGPAGLSGQQVNLNGLTTITTNNAAQIPLKVKGAASQSASLQEWQNSSDTVKARITPNGSLAIRSPVIIDDGSVALTLDNSFEFGLYSGFALFQAYNRATTTALPVWYEGTRHYFSGGPIILGANTVATADHIINYGTNTVIFNEQGRDADFRIEGDTKPNLFVVDAGTDSVSIDGDLTVADEAYGSGWNGSLEVPTKNAVYDQVELKAPIASPSFTGTANFAGNITQDENAALVLDAALSADGKYSGIVEAGTAGTTLAFGDIVYLAAADSRWELADADAASTAGDVKLGICVLAAGADGNATVVLLAGKVRADAVFPSFTISAPVYISTTAGDLTNTAPSGTDDVIRIVGQGNTADELSFFPDNTYITHT